MTAVPGSSSELGEAMSVWIKTIIHHHCRLFQGRAQKDSSGITQLFFKYSSLPATCPAASRNRLCTIPSHLSPLKPTAVIAPEPVPLCTPGFWYKGITDYRATVGKDQQSSLFLPVWFSASVEFTSNTTSSEREKEKEHA